MLFNSFAFLIFFYFAHLLYWNVSEKNRPRILIFASFVFYCWWSLPFFFHFLFIVGLNYFVYSAFRKKYTGKVLALIVSINLTNLIFFKYFYFLTKTLGDITSQKLFYDFSSKNSPVYINIVLPLAISFYTFQIIAFHADEFRGGMKVNVKLHEFILFIMFFPQLIAGPILRTNEFLPQIGKKKRIGNRTLDVAVYFILSGLVKKVVIADSIAYRIDPVFLNPGHYSWQSIMIAVYAFSIQIYCDFAGYTDMARGLAFSLGYKIPANFRAPYFSVSFREFWTRWHITLSTWLRDYLYIPLGGNRNGKPDTYLNLGITMILGGLWHGANYTFLIWGLLQGIYLSVERFFFPVMELTLKAKIIRGIIIFHMVTFSWIFFRSDSIHTALTLLSQLSGGGGKKMYDPDFIAICFLLFLFLHVIEYGKFKIPSFLPGKKYLYPAMALIVSIAVATLGSRSGAFIYFQF
ncbi:MAG: MBOAT family protein [Leptospira sp.]|nr:MBOAT family protein [Leptospira sp.]